MTTLIKLTSYASLVGVASLNTRSACKLSVIKDYKYVFITFGVNSAVQVQSLKGGIWTAK